MPDWQEPAEEDEAEPLPRWVTRRLVAWGVWLIIAIVGVVATSHRWWTIPAALAIGVIILGVHYMWWPEIPVSRVPPPAPLPRPGAPEPETDEDDIVIVRRKNE